MMLAHVQNLGPLQTFSNEFSGVTRVRPKLHMACSIAHKQPQPKRIGVTRIVAKKNDQKLQICLVHIFCSVFPKVP